VNKPYRERRAILEKTVKKTKALQLSPMVVGDGTTLFEAAKQQHLEGIVAKKLDAPYEPGKRSKAWLKMKTVYDADVVIAGWSQGEGRRAGELGSLVMAAYDGDRLRYVGGVGTGFTDRTLREVQEALVPLATEAVPFTSQELRGKPALRRAHWVRPELVAIIEFRELTGDFKLRQPSFKGFRDDKSPAECTLEELKRAAGFSH
jgi:bifunctional non-homologous end joining protein LigD